MLEKEQIKYKINNNTLLLDCRKAIFWEEESALLLSDLHLGKAEHFQRSGIAVPSQKKTFDRLSGLISDYPAKKLFILGDLFHSVNNNSSNDFIEYFANYDIEKHLILGNHDILGKNIYESLNLITHEYLEINNIVLVHDPKDAPEGKFSLSGHVHPKVKLSGKGKQYLSLPCFYFGSNLGILPAFGDFTGGHHIKPKKEDDIFVIADKEVIKIN